jgi:hypothetical protein
LIKIELLQNKKNSILQPGIILKKIEMLQGRLGKYPPSPLTIKMPSTTYPASLPELMAMRSEIESRITAIMSGGGSIVASGGSSKPAKKVATKRSSGPSAWGDWTKQVVEENKQELEAFKAEQATKQGAHLKWMGAGGPGSGRFGKDSDAWKGFKSEWDASHPKQPASSGASTASSDSEEAPSAEKKRRGPKKLSEMSEEERVAHDAKKLQKRQAKNKDAEVAATGADLGRAQGGSTATQPSLTSIPEESQVTFAGDADEEESVELLPFVLDGTKYVRLGTKSGESSEPVWATGDLWYFKKTAVNNKGDYVGKLDDDGSIDADAEEPEVE